jgi:hypothetical protein
MPASGRSPDGHAGAGASPIRSIDINGRRLIAAPCGCASHSRNVRIAVTTSFASAAASSKSKAFQPRNACPTAVLS